MQYDNLKKQLYQFLSPKIKTKFSTIKINQEFKQQCKHLDLKTLNTFLLFIGNSRSGTTLVKSIIEAHPEAIIGHELNILKYLIRGESWSLIYKRLALSSIKFNKNPTWTGYSYEISKSKTLKDQITLIGDKKAYKTTQILSQNSKLLLQLMNNNLSLKIIRCIRNPYDVIATRHLKNHKSIEDLIDYYFHLEVEAEKIANIISSNQVCYLYLEDVIQNPTLQIEQLFKVLSLPLDKELLKNCVNSIHSEIHQSRHKVKWKKSEIDKIASFILKTEHLKSHYSKNNQVIF